MRIRCKSSVFAIDIKVFPLRLCAFARDLFFFSQGFINEFVFVSEDRAIFYADPGGI